MKVTDRAQAPPPPKVPERERPQPPPRPEKVERPEPPKSRDVGRNVDVQA